jgi:membrane protein DedA with SNARE-associated domain
MDSVFGWISQYGYAGLFALLMFGIAGLPIPDETLLVISGYLISQGRLQALPTFLWCVSGSVCGISLSYVIGRFVGHPVIYRYGRYVYIKPEHVERVHSWYRRTGEWLLTFGYFIPGVRHFTALVAGMSELEYWVFALFAYSGAAIWVLSFLTLGYFVGDHWQAALDVFHRYTLLVVGIALLLGLLVWWWRRRSLNLRKGRLS